MFRIFWAVLLTIFLAPSLFAQAAANVEIHQPQLEGEASEREAEKRAAEEAAAGEAQKRKAVEKAPVVTYAQVLADPDNIDLNYAYAKSQVAQGNLRGAMSTLERILMVDPSLHKVRLFYALVLYRLDNLSEAERELKRLTEVPIPAGLKSEIEEILAKIASRRRRVNIDATLGLGFDYDTNRNAAPSSGQRLFANTLVTLTDLSLRQQDTAIIALANVKITYDLGDQAGHELFTSLTHYRAEQTVEDNLDLQAFTGIFGGKWKMVSGDYTTRIKFDHVRLSEETFLRTVGAGLKWEKKFTGKLSGSINADVQHQDYENTSDVPVADERIGDQYDLGFRVGYILRPKHRIGGGFAYRSKEARMKYNGYERYSFLFDYSWLLGKGRFLLTNLSGSLDRYNTPDVAISPLIRNDENFRMRFTYGTPLGFVWKSLKDLTFTASYEYVHTVSNMTNYAYDNSKLSSLFTYKWSW